jgi:hypothetical protein
MIAKDMDLCEWLGDHGDPCVDIQPRLGTIATESACSGWHLPKLAWPRIPDSLMVWIWMVMFLGCHLSLFLPERFPMARPSRFSFALGELGLTSLTHDSSSFSILCSQIQTLNEFEP